jgi:hypothetical protein
VVQPGGVEPPTYRSVVCRSIQLSYGCTRRLPSCGRRIVEHPADGCKPPFQDDQHDPGDGHSSSPGLALLDEVYSIRPVRGEEAEA